MQTDLLSLADYAYKTNTEEGRIEVGVRVVLKKKKEVLEGFLFSNIKCRR